MNDYINNTIKNNIDFESVYKVCNYALEKLKVKKPIFNITIVDNKKIRSINKKYRNKDVETDVLSFAFEEEDNIKYHNFRFLGDIYISYEKILEQSNLYDHSLERELCYLSLHGLLHLLGYNHENSDEKKIMRALEEEILDECEITR